MDGCQQAIAKMESAKNSLQNALDILEKDLVMTDEAFKQSQFVSMKNKIDEAINEVNG